jgi:hypothetical protein
MVTKILIGLGFKRGVLLGLLFPLELECRILLGVGLLLACMRAL